MVDPRRVAFATKHGKAAQVGPALTGVGLTVVEHALDTDAFGTFTRTVARAGDQREAARRKCEAALAADRDAGWALASEGAFGPWPSLPWVAQGRELLLLRSREGVEIAAVDVTLDTAFAHEVVATEAEARVLLARVGFPEQAVFVASAPAGDVDPSLGDPSCALVDAISVDDEGALACALREKLAASGRAWLESDLRAHRSPLRRASLVRAATRLAETFRARCPRCAHPGFAVARFSGQSACEACGGATDRPALEHRRCPACGAEERRALDTRAPNTTCPRCNP